MAVVMVGGAASDGGGGGGVTARVRLTWLNLRPMLGGFYRGFRVKLLEASPRVFLSNFHWWPR